MRSRLAAEIAEQPRVLATVLGEQAHALQAVRETVRQHHRVLMLGIGSSRHVAGYGVACFEALTGTSVSLLPAPGGGVALPAMSADDVLVVVSQSGSTPALQPVVETALAVGAAVVSLTNAHGSPLERLAHLSLHACAGEESVVPATKSVTASMLLLRALAAPVPTAALVDVVRGLVVDQPSAVRFLADVDLPQLVVASGFAAEHIADEVALKLAEVTAHLAVSETVVDYLHGPAAVPAHVLGLLDPDDPNTDAVLGLPSVLTVGTSLSFDLPLASTGDPSLDAIARLVAGQCLALAWAGARSIDPDDPRGLKKVTLSL